LLKTCAESAVTRAGFIYKRIFAYPTERLCVAAKRFYSDGSARETAPTAKVPSSTEPAQDVVIAKLPSPSQPTIVETGLASWYGPGFHGKLTASGEVFNQAKFTAAHRTLPWGSRVRVTNLANGKSVIVQINDRGPAVKGRIIDLSRAAARALDMVSAGITAVRVEWLSESDGSNELVQQGR
jgi:rare lipoprotein A